MLTPPWMGGYFPIMHIRIANPLNYLQGTTFGVSNVCPIDAGGRGRPALHAREPNRYSGTTESSEARETIAMSHFQLLPGDCQAGWCPPQTHLFVSDTPDLRDLSSRKASRSRCNWLDWLARHSHRRPTDAADEREFDGNRIAMPINRNGARDSLPILPKRACHAVLFPSTAQP